MFFDLIVSSAGFIIFSFKPISKAEYDMLYIFAFQNLEIIHYYCLCRQIGSRVVKFNPSKQVSWV